MRIIVTGGSGFIGSAFIRNAINKNHEIINIDCLTYAACQDNLRSVSKHMSIKVRLCWQETEVVQLIVSIYVQN